MSDILNVLPPVAVIGLSGVLAFISAYAGMYAAIAPSRTTEAGKRLGIKRMAVAGTGADRKKLIQDQVKESEKRRAKGGAPNSLSRLLERAGMGKGVLAYMLTFVGIALAAIFGLLSFGFPPLMAVATLPLTLYILPRFWVKRAIKKREKKFVEEFPNAIDVLVRGVRTGLPVNDGLRLISREMQEPVAGEFQRLVDSFTVGVSLEDGLRRMYERMPLPEVNFFSIVLIIQKQTGGNLAEALSNLSTVIRDRKKLQNKIKALSSEAKASAAIIGSLPFVLGFILSLVSPGYVTLLFTETRGQIMVAGGLFWMGLGTFVMKQMIDIDI